MPNRCSTCRWWDEMDYHGYCRAGRPEQVFTVEGRNGCVEGRVYTAWPKTSPDDWCGAWQGRDTIGKFAEGLDDPVDPGDLPDKV